MTGIAGDRQTCTGSIDVGGANNQSGVGRADIDKITAGTLEVGMAIRTWLSHVRLASRTIGGLMIGRMACTLVMTRRTLTSAVVGASTAIRHGEGTTIGGFEHTICLMTGGTLVMDQFIGAVHIDTSGIASDTGVTVCSRTAIRRISNQRCVVGVLVVSEVGAVASATGTTTVGAAKACANRHCADRIARTRQADHAAIGLMTGRARIMDHGVTAIDRIATEGVTGRAGSIGLNHAGMYY